MTGAKKNLGKQRNTRRLSILSEIRRNDGDGIGSRSETPPAASVSDANAPRPNVVKSAKSVHRKETPIEFNPECSQSRWGLTDRQFKKVFVYFVSISRRCSPAVRDQLVHAAKTFPKAMYPTIPSNKSANPNPAMPVVTPAPPTPTGTHLLGPRMISNKPYWMLKAPLLQDNFYSSVVDWSRKNCLGIGLGSSLYVRDAETKSQVKLCDFGVGILIAVGTNRGVIQIYEVLGSIHLRTLYGQSSRITSIDWSSNTQLITGAGDGSICFRDLKSKGQFDNVVTRLVGHQGDVCGLKWAQHPSPDKYLASGGDDNNLLLWDHTMLRNPVYKFDEHQAAVRAVAWSPHSNGLLGSGGGNADQHIRFWDTQVGAALGGVNTESDVCNMAWSMEADEIMPELSTLATLKGHTARVLYLAVSPENENIVTGAGDGTLRFWNAFGRSQRKRWERLGK
ncbi:Protein FIZZY-RELATED 2 [Podochytrium sp. JEL0797]|nr:Protein FIZZY-RELATED 2 [Podochytrium sp. JEL0797]